jgi:Glycosyl transferase family 2
MSALLYCSAITIRAVIRVSLRQRATRLSMRLFESATWSRSATQSGRGDAQLKHDCEALLMRARAQDLRIGTLVAENNSFRQVLSDVQSAHHELKLQAQERGPLLEELEARKNEEVAQLKHDCEALLTRARAQELRIGTLVAENNSFRQVLSDVQSAHHELKLQAQKRAPLLEELEARKNEEVIIRRERKGLRIAYVTAVRNEQERIYHHLNYYYLIGIRDFFLCDHGSTDGTAALIERFRLENPDANVVCVFDPTPGHYQGIRMTVLADLAYSYGCDWILALDADEILLSRDGLPDLEAFIAHEELRNKQYGHVLLPLVNYLPTTKDPVKESNPFLRLKFRENNDCQAEIWWPPKVFAKWRRGMFIGEGNHEIIGLTERIDLLENPLYLAHFPYSTMDQVVAKVVKGGRSFEHAPELGPLIGWHWKEAYEQYQLKGEQAIYDWFDGWHRDASQLSFHPLEAAWFKPARQKSTQLDQNYVRSANVLNCAPSTNLASQCVR